jgi:hypothetical protein
MPTEDERVGRLLNAQANAVALFDEVVARGIIAPHGQTILEAIFAADDAACDLSFGRDGWIRTGGLLLLIAAMSGRRVTELKAKLIRASSILTWTWRLSA